MTSSFSIGHAATASSDSSSVILLNDKLRCSSSGNGGGSSCGDMSSSVDSFLGISLASLTESGGWGESFTAGEEMNKILAMRKGLLGQIH
jgi:hypothetical protein